MFRNSEKILVLQDKVRELESMIQTERHVNYLQNVRTDRLLEYLKLREIDVPSQTQLVPIDPVIPLEELVEKARKKASDGMS